MKITVDKPYFVWYTMYIMRNKERHTNGICK